MPAEIFEVNTKGSCLLCFKLCSLSPQEWDARKHLNESNISTTSIKLLLRYLKIDIFKVTNFSSSYQKWMDGMENIDLIVSLCDKCTSVTNAFLELFQRFERIRMRLDECAASLCNIIKQGDTIERKEEFRRRMKTRIPHELINLSIAENLRKETMQKCSEKLNSSIPRVTVCSDNANHQASQIKSNWPFTNPSAVSTSTKTRLNEVFNHSLDTSNDITTRNKNEFDAEYFPEPLVKVETVLEVNEVNFEFEGESMFYDENDTEGDSSSQMENNFHPQEKNLPQNTSLTSINSLIGQLPSPFANTISAGKLKKYVCKVCGMQCSNSTGYARHCRTHTGEKKFHCDLCGKASAESYNHRLHMISVHPIHTLANDLPPGTTEESLKAAVQNVVDKHRKIPNDKRPYGCPHCDKQFLTMFYCKYHIMTSHLPEVLEYLEGMPTLQMSISKPEQSFKCPSKSGGVSGVHYQQPNRIQHFATKKTSRMINSQRQQEVLKCLYCGKVSKNLSDHLDHLHGVHTLQSFSDKLPHATTEDNLKQVLDQKCMTLEPKVSIFDVNKYQCRFCLVGGYLKPSRMRVHIMRVHLKDVVSELVSANTVTKPMPSSVSSPENSFTVKQETQNRSVDNHTEIDYPAVNLQCSFCENISLDDTTHQDHMMTFHTYQFFSKSIPCSTTEAQLMTAIKGVFSQCRISKLGQRPHECAHCSSVFRETESLRHHILAAHFDKIFSKLQADSRMNNKIANQETDEWNQRRSSDGTFDCPHCGKLFPSKSDYRAHAIGVHTGHFVSKFLPCCTLPPEQLEKAVDKVVLKELEQLSPEQQKKFTCAQCHAIFHKKYFLKVHLLRAHLNKVVAELQNLFLIALPVQAITPTQSSTESNAYEEPVQIPGTSNMFQQSVASFEQGNDIRFNNFQERAAPLENVDYSDLSFTIPAVPVEDEAMVEMEQNDVQHRALFDPLTFYQ